MHDTGTPAPAPESSGVDSVMKSYTRGVIVALLVTVSFIAGVFVGDLRPAAEQEAAVEHRLVGIGSDAPPEIVDVPFGQFWEVWNMVKQRYVKKDVADIDLFYGALEGMVASLEDPYSVYFDPEVAAQFASELNGEFQGIGAEIGLKKNQLIVIAPLPETPAFRAGLKPKDAILMIDEVETAGMSLDEAVRRIRGEGGTTVTLSVWREGFEEPKEFAIVRDTIVVEPVKLAIDERDGKRFAHLTVTHFNEQTEPKFKEAVRKLLLESVDGVVLDLRNNPGGYLDVAVALAGEWAQHSVIVAERFNDGDVRNYTSDGSARLMHMPTVVLVNGGSASASEIVAGALQDYGLAYLIGETTFGKGSVQDYMEFEDGSAVKLTIAEWLTPDGRMINEAGIEPDEAVELTEEDYDNDRDPQLDRAYEALAKPETKLAAPAPAAE